MNKQEFMVIYDEASRSVNSDIEDMKERFAQSEAHRRVLDAARDAYLKMDKLNDELERKQQEIDDMEEQLEQKDAEIAELRQQLLEAQNANLESEKQHLVAEVKAKPMEIHNHFESGSSSQVFNDKVSGRFEKKVKKDKKDKKDKKRWKKIVRKML